MYLLFFWSGKLGKIKDENLSKKLSDVVYGQKNQSGPRPNHTYMCTTLIQGTK
jgi:hypothetical protein